RAALVGEHDRLRRRQGVPFRRGVVREVAGGGLRGAPLPNVALARSGARRELGGGERARGGERLVQPELVADDDHRGGERTAEVRERLLDEFLDFLLRGRGGA